MKNATTDAHLSLRADEFLWRAGGLTEAHAYILPVVRDWLSAAGAKTVLDIGCGNAAFTNELARAGLQMTGTDSSHSGLEIARAEYPAVKLRHSSIDEPLETDLRGQYDAAIAVEVIEHLFFPRHLFERASEALRPGGIFIVSTPYHGYWKNLAVALAGKYDEHWHPLRDFGHVKFFSLETLGALFEEQGFTVARQRRCGRVPALAKSMIVQGRKRP